MLNILMIAILVMLALCSIGAMLILAYGLIAAVYHWWHEGKFHLPDWF